MRTPTVSCIMPTANRINYIPIAIAYFLNQSYDDAELIIVDDGLESVINSIPNNDKIKYFYTSPLETIGVKRNFACQHARGQFIVHWDDDDYYAQDWIDRQIRALKISSADIVGLNEIIFFSPLVRKFWDYANTDSERPWLSGATLAYKRKFWEEHRFNNIQVGEDYDFIWNSNAKLYAHKYPNGFIATLHAGNTTLKPFENPKHKKNAISHMNIDFQGEAENPSSE